MPQDRPLLVFFGHHKCASSSNAAVISRVARELGLHHDSVSLPATFGSNLNGWVQANQIDFLAYRLADYEYVKDLANFKGYHVIRDPRDIVVSAYFSHLYSHPVEGFPAIAAQRRLLETMSEEDGLLCEMESRAVQFKAMAEWNYSLPHVLEVKFEEMVSNPYKHYLEIFRFLGLVEEQRYNLNRRTVHYFYRCLRSIEDRNERRVSLNLYPKQLPVERVLGIIWELNFDRQTGGRKQGQEDVHHHYRKGAPGDWRNHFTAQHIAYFKEHYNDALIKLGYEQDADW